MKLHLFLVFLGLSAIVGLALTGKQPTAGRAKLILRKAFVFSRYTNKFNKHYDSMAEELARQKVYLARALKAFISLVAYKYHKQNYFLKINEMSDRTDAELQSRYNNQLLQDSIEKDSKEGHSRMDLRETPVASLEDIETKLNEIVDQPEFESIANELMNSAPMSQSKVLKEPKQRVVDRASLTVDDLLTAPDNKDPQILPDVPSSNPEYEAPELNSFGSEDVEGEHKLHSNEDYRLISSLPGYSYVSSIISEAKILLFGFEDQTSEDIEQPKGRGELESYNNDGVIIDHRRSGCLTEPKNQKMCASCHIFSTTALYEWRYCKEKGTLTSFSEQYALDCGDRAGLEGCEGGRVEDVGNFYGKYGIELSSKYPYRGRFDGCPYEWDISSGQMGYLKLTSSQGSIMRVKYESLLEVLKSQPVLMALAVPDHFNHYGGGIDDGKDCNEENKHTMLLVGMGRKNGIDYWIFRNSFGSNWGEEGHYRLEMAAKKKCFLYGASGWYVQAEGERTVFMSSTNKYRQVNLKEKRRNAKKEAAFTFSH